MSKHQVVERKKVTASARAQISTRKVRKSVNTNNHGSFLQDQQSSENMGKQPISDGHNPSSDNNPTVQLWQS